MPIAAQPDPATYRKSKKPTVNAEAYNPYSHQQEIHQSMEQPSSVENKRSINNMPHKMDSEGDVNFSTANLDEMLEKIEADGLVKKSRSRSDVTKISKYLKPRVPASVKAKEKKAQKAQKQSRDNSVERQYNITKPTKPKIREVTADSLDRLLNQLKKCELATSSPKTSPKHPEKRAQQKEYEKMIEISTDDEARRQRHETNQVISNKSFNYKDITTQMLRSQSEVRAYCGSANDFSNNMTRDIKQTHSTASAKTSSSGPKLPPLDDLGALELHRSKSYIVNLIDRALSKELGTVPSDRSRREVFETMSPRKAIETVNRHAACARSQKEISLEITSALTESILSNATAPPGDTDSRVASSSASAKTCCCGAEEPNYIKQLKQLRWGHLKHIQREVRRLEDLERFLDSCSITTIPEL
nr:unnamed protein product [Callosobruchus analis]